MSSATGRDAHLDLGRHLLHVGSGDRALEQFRAALTVDPHCATAHALLALALSQLARYRAAEHEADLALQIDPADPFHHYTKALVLADVHRWREAREFIERAIAMDPYRAHYFSLLSHICRNLEQLPAAEEAARRALELDPESEHANLQLAHSLNDQQRHDESHDAFAQALTAAPEDADVHNGMGLFFLRKRAPDRALHHFREALRLDPLHEPAQHNLILALGAKNWFYKLFWRWNLFLWRFPRNVRIVLAFSVLAFSEFNEALVRQVPAYQPYGLALALLLFAFCLYTWLAHPIFSWYVQFQARRIPRTPTPTPPDSRTET